MTEITKERRREINEPLKRFVRNKNTPEELEALRFGLIAARVLNGLTTDEAQERFGEGEDISIDRIESGQQKVPTDWHFLRKAAEVYAVSSDFLLGLSPHIEIDSKVTQQFAFMRTMQEILRRDAEERASAIITYVSADSPQAAEYQRVCDAATAICKAMSVMRNKYDFDEMRGSAPVVAAVDALGAALQPFRSKLKQFRSLEAYFADTQSGKLPVIPYLMERYRQQDIQDDLLEGV